MGKALPMGIPWVPPMGMAWAIPWAWLFYRWLQCAPPFIPNGKCHGIALGFLIGHSMGKALLWALHGCLPHGHGMGHSMDKALLWWLHGCLPQPPFPCPCHGIALGFLIGHSMGKALLWAFHGCPLWPWNGPFHGHGSSIGGCIVHLPPSSPMVNAMALHWAS